MLIIDLSPSLYLKKRSATFPILGSFEVSPRSERTRARQLVATYPGRRRKLNHLRKFVSLPVSSRFLQLQNIFGPALSRNRRVRFPDFRIVSFATQEVDQGVVANGGLIFLQ